MGQKDYFDLLDLALDGTPIYVAKNWKTGNAFNPGKQFLVGKKQLPYDHRSIGFTELVFDLDAPSYSANVRLAKRLKQHLDDNTIPFQMFWSGNKGFHFHIFLEVDITDKEVKETLNKAKEVGLDVFKELRMMVANNILSQSGFTSTEIEKYFDWKKISWKYNPDRFAPLIRCCGGENVKINRDGREVRNFKTVLATIPDRKPVGELAYPTVINTYKIDEFSLAQAVKEKLDSDTLPRATAPSEFTGKFLGLPCVVKLREEGIKSGERNKGAQVLSVACKLDGLDIGQARQVLSEYVNVLPRLPEPYTIDEAIRWLEWIYQQEKAFWPCTLKGTSHCDLMGCSFNLKAHKEELDFLRAENPLLIVKDVLDEMVVGEDSLKMAMFLLYLTKGGVPEWCVLLDGEASSGKSHVMKAVAKLFGEEDEDYFVFSRVTQASLNHLGEMQEKLRHKIVLIEELQGARNVIEQLRVLISEGVLTLMTTEEEMVEGVKKHVMKTKKVDLRGTLFVTCNAEEYDEGDQLKTRAWILNTDMSMSQTQKIIGSYLGNKSGSEVGKDPENLSRVQRSMKFLTYYEHVLFPFAEELKDMIPVNLVRARRDIKKLFGLISAHANLHQYQRKICIDNRGNKILIADWRDVYGVLTWVGDLFEATTQSVGAADLDHYNSIRVGFNPHLGDTFGMEDVKRWCKVADGTARNVMSRLCGAGFFKNNTSGFKGTLAEYEFTNTVPMKPSDMKEYAKLCVGADYEKKIEGWAEKNKLKLLSHPG